jgi:hypothetical protein
MAKRIDTKASRDDTLLPSLPPWQATDEAWRIGLRLLSEVAEAATRATERWPVAGYLPEERLEAIRGYLPAALRERVDSQARKWAIACQTGGLEELRHEQARMLRAWAAVGDALQGTSPETLTWQWQMADGSLLVLVRSRADLIHVRPPTGSQVWCVEEIARLIEGLPAEVQKLKATFRGSTLAAIAGAEKNNGEPAPAVEPFRDDDLDQVNWLSEPGWQPPER